MRRESYLGAWLGLLTLSAIAACSGRATDLTAVGNDSESHFLVHCQLGGCAAGLSCLFGVCTALCAGDSDCSSWSGGAVCRSASTAEASSQQQWCDVECSESADCRGLGPSFGCSSGLCRVDGAPIAGGFARACTDDTQCAGGLSCFDNTCTQLCASAADCNFPSATCPVFLREDGTRVGGRCVSKCQELPDDPAAQHGQCSFLGAGGRCAAGSCVETLAGQCGDVGQPGAQWSCYEDIAADVFRARHDLLLGEELCLETADGRVFDVTYRRCPDSTCTGGRAGCAVGGLVLESEPAPLEPPNTNATALVQARGEVRLRTPFRLQFDLLDPLESCEYSVSARFWSIHFYDGYSYLSPYTAELSLRGTPPSSALSTQAIAGGFWQVAHAASLAHDENGTGGVIIEDSEADVQLLSGGERCARIQGHVGVVARDSLANTVNDTLQRWGAGVDDTVECTPCGQLGCELACRFR